MSSMLPNKTENIINHNSSLTTKFSNEEFRIESGEDYVATWIAQSTEGFFFLPTIDYFLDYFQNFYFFPVESTMAKNKFYRIVIKSVATIFLVLPEGGVALMLCLLTASAYRACKVRQILVHTPAINANTAKVSSIVSKTQTNNFHSPEINLHRPKV